MLCIENFDRRDCWIDESNQITSTNTWSIDKVEDG
jgi:hypothetical protein